jgi:hypothetical protein
MKKKLILFIVLLVSLVLLTGCGDSATIDTYSDPSFTKGSISKLAVFPMQNTRLAPSQSRQVNRDVTQGVNSINPNIEIMGAAKATRIINEHSLADEWAKFLDDYNSSGIPNSQLLFEIGDALNVDAIMQGEIVDVYQRDGKYGGDTALSRVTVRYSILSTDSGKLLWEATSRGSRESATTLADAPPLIEVIQLAQEKILNNLAL